MLWLALSLVVVVVIAIALVARVQRRRALGVAPEAAPGPALFTGEPPPTAGDLPPDDDSNA